MCACAYARVGRSELISTCHSTVAVCRLVGVNVSLLGLVVFSVALELDSSFLCLSLCLSLSFSLLITGTDVIRQVVEASRQDLSVRQPVASMSSSDMLYSDKDN